MKREKLYKEQIHHTTADLPVALHRMKYPCGTDVLFYLHWHKEFEFFVVTEGRIEFTIESNTYLLEPGDCVFINSDAYHSAKMLEEKVVVSLPLTSLMNFYRKTCIQIFPADTYDQFLTAS